MIHNVMLPQGTQLVFRREDDGPVLLSVEAVYLDMLLLSSQRSTRVSRVNEDDRLWWLPAFTALVNKKYGTDFNDTEGWVIARTTSMVGERLKKTFDSIQMSLQSTESMLSSLPQNKSKDSISTSQDTEQSENCKTEFANNL